MTPARGKTTGKRPSGTRRPDGAKPSGGRSSGTGRGRERPGLGTRVEEARAILGAVVDELDPDRLTGGDATILYGALAGVERLVVAGKALLAPRIEASQVWREGGHRDAAGHLADLEGVSPGQARRTLEVGTALGSLPDTAAACRKGSLSGPKLAALAGAGRVDPTREGELLSGAEAEPLAETAARCRQVRANAATVDPDATYRAIHAQRFFRSWTDPEGAFCYAGRDTPDRGARLLAYLHPTARALRRARSRAGLPSESEAALRADVLYGLVTRPSALSGAPAAGETTESGAEGSLSAVPALPGLGSTAPSEADALDPELADLCARPPVASVVVRVDRDALLRGRLADAERCEVDGIGPVPVSVAQALLNDAFVALCFHRAGDIQAIAHLGRTIRRPLRTAVVERDRCCVVPGCGTTLGLEIDHTLPLAERGPTSFDNLALLCHHHHYLKTHQGWTLARTGTTKEGKPQWSFTPAPAFGQEPGLGTDTPEGREWVRSWQRQRE